MNDGQQDTHTEHGPQPEGNPSDTPTSEGGATPGLSLPLLPDDHPLYTSGALISTIPQRRSSAKREDAKADTVEPSPTPTGESAPS